MAAGDLITLDQALAWLGQTSDTNGIVAMLISSCSTSIQSWIGYQLASQNYTNTYNGIGSHRQLLGPRPVTAVSAVTVDGINIPQAVVPTIPGYLFDSKYLFITRGGAWSNGQFSTDRLIRGFQNVVVSFTAGFAAIPVDIQNACMMWVAQNFEMIGLNPALKKLRAGDTEMDFALTTLVGKTTILLPPYLAMVLQPYKRVAY